MIGKIKRRDVRQNISQHNQNLLVSQKNSSSYQWQSILKTDYYYMGPKNRVWDSYYLTRMLDRLFGIIVILALSNLMLRAQAPMPKNAANPPEKSPSISVTPRPLVKAWKILDLEGLLGAGFEGGRQYDNGRNLFQQATCIKCHRFNETGSTAGPALTKVALKYGPLELLTHVMEPSKEVSEIYQQHEVILKDGSTILGRLVSSKGGRVILNIDIQDRDALKVIEPKFIKSMGPSKISLMPSNLLNTLHENDILDLLAYLLAKGDPTDPMFK